MHTRAGSLEFLNMSWGRWLWQWYLLTLHFSYKQLFPLPRTVHREHFGMHCSMDNISIYVGLCQPCSGWTSVTLEQTWTCGRFCEALVPFWIALTVCISWCPADNFLFSFGTYRGTYQWYKCPCCCEGTATLRTLPQTASGNKEEGLWDPAGVMCLWTKNVACLKT